jgi:hypothetical protein
MRKHPALDMTKKAQPSANSQIAAVSAGPAAKEPPASILVQAELTRWQSILVETRQDELKFMDERFHDLLNELYDSANVCVDSYQTFSKSHTKWRCGIIVGTSVVAVTNLIAAYKDVRNFAGGIVSLLAAVLAIGLTMLASLESFYNSSKKAQAYRESRELFLDAARDFDRRWDVYVRPFTDTAEACVNGAELYRQLIAKDSEIRAKYEELTQTPEGSKKEDKGSKQ